MYTTGSGSGLEGTISHEFWKEGLGMLVSAPQRPLGDRSASWVRNGGRGEGPAHSGHLRGTELRGYSLWACRGSTEKNDGGW